ncbi:TPA: hypothetical protein EYO57_25150 [Candidatus Poribacteria bacterium]|nr:hypothetical protein [Candidatus Poribacteria bacterium]
MFNVKQNINTALTDRIMEKRKCKRSSCRVYSSNLRRINKEFSEEPFTVNLKWLQKDAKVILAKIKRLSSVNKQRNFVSASLIGFDLLKDTKNQEVYNAYLKVLNKKKAELQRSGEMTEKEKQKFVPWKQIIKLRRLLGREVNLSRLYQREKVTKKDFQKLQRYLVLMLMTELPPVRNEYADVTIMTDKEQKESTGKNVLLTSRGGYKFIWVKYKTAGTYGKIVIFVPKYSKSLQRLLVKHVKYLRKHFPGNKALLLNQNFGPLTRNALTKYLQRLFKTYFKKNVSTTAIRQSFLTNRYSKSALEEHSDIARAMGHSRATQQADYVKKI